MHAAWLQQHVQTSSILLKTTEKNSVIPKYEVQHTDDVSVGIIPEELYECAKAGADVCPVSAIKIEPIEE